MNKLIYGITLIIGLTVTQAQTQKPNIVFIVVDDLGYGDVGFNGSKFYETPNLDKLAKESLVFDNSYTYPTCSPSRTAIFTGKQSFRTGIYTVPVLEKGTDQENIFSRWTVGREHPIYAEPLAEAGYKSIHLGKWHIVGPDPLNELNMHYPLTKRLGQPDPGNYDWVALHKSKEVQQYYPEGRGFLKNVGGTFRGDPAFELGGYKSETKGYKAPFSNPFIETKKGDEWLTDRLTDEALEFMEAHKKEPFLINLDFYAVHNPIVARNQESLDKYSNKEGDPIMGQGLGKRRQTMVEYATMVESVDQNIQRVIDYLDKNNLRENTMIIVTSDNGQNEGPSTNNLLRDSKGYIYEGGIKVPTLVNWKGKVNARRTDVAISVLDFFPTFMDVAGIKDYNGILDGNSITPEFKKDTKFFVKRPIFLQVSSQYKHGTCSVIRKKEFKLIQFLADGKLELYDLSKDPLEANNIAESNKKVTKKLLAELVKWRHSNHVPLPPNSVVD
ncbi:sulfatase [Flavobacterium sp. 7A]|uniref:sulfatase n=1 Tax=Flavobacterium sp. 7A TaxID=2940571 RepID=UPI0022260ABA|nr:sulfatase [Flavobacterium sp. 7A]MCW2118791.1 arylsulfatase A-like enzyme [Flavobacterium sp. 7A]